MKYLYILLFLFSTSISYLSAETIELSEDKNFRNIGRYLEYATPSKEHSSLIDILKTEQTWTQNPQKTISFPKWKDPIWFRFHLNYDGNSPHTFYLHFSSPVVDHFEMHYFYKGRWVSLRSGEQVLQKDKPLYSHIAAFPLPLSPGEERTIYVRIESANPIFNFVSIYNTRSFLSYAKKNDIFFAAYFGAGGLMFLYSLFLAYTLRYRQFFFYFFYLSTILLINLFSTGFMQYIELGSSHAWKNYLFPVGIYLTCIFGLIFTIEFLDIRKQYPRIAKLTNAFIISFLLLIPSLLFIELRLYIQIAVSLVIVPIIFSLSISFYCLIRNRRMIENYLFFFAMSSVLIGAAINSLTVQGVLEPHSIALYTLPLGSAVEIFLLAMALMVKVRQLRKEMEAKQEIDMQMKLAQKLQKDLLPKNIDSVLGYKLGFRYLPTSEIGGDFVQIIEKEDSFGLFLCDVSGHGIPAAMVASMAKVSLQIWADHLDEPGFAVEKIRSSLLDNLSGHFLSACFVYINPKQEIIKVVNAGHHPMIYLDREGNTEYYTAQGRAITEYISLDVQEKQFPLPKKGSLILYTDGVLEARNPNKSIDLFGEERLLDVLKENAKSDPQTICDHVLDEVFKFQKIKRADDDITILSIALEQNAN